MLRNGTERNTEKRGGNRRTKARKRKGQGIAVRVAGRHISGLARPRAYELLQLNYSALASVLIVLLSPKHFYLDRNYWEGIEKKMKRNPSIQAPLPHFSEST